MTTELKDVLVKNEVALKTAEDICSKLAQKLGESEHTRFSNI